jgi:hypothetical protein
MTLATPAATLAPISALPAEQNLELYRGDSFPLRVDVVDAAGAPLDVTTATWDADIRLTPDTATTIASFTVTPVAGTPSAVNLMLDPLSSALLPATSVYDLEMTLAGFVYTLIYGKITTKFDVSRVL